MGLGPPVVALYHQMKMLGLFEGVSSVMELGSQNAWVSEPNAIYRLCKAFGKEAPSPATMENFLNKTAPARSLYEALGFTYNCVDADGKYGALVLDINFAGVPPEHKGRYDFTTNHGTTEHLINQVNAFKMIHDLTKPGGMMLHALPFLGQVDHGFFNYHPNLFDSLARYNSYKTLGVWIGIDWQLTSFIPWHPQLLDFLVLSPKSTGLLIVLHQKQYDTEFCVPFQGVYEATKTDDVSANYCFVVDGEYYDGRRDKFVTKEHLMAAAKTSPPPSSGSAALSNARARELGGELLRRVSPAVGYLAKRLKRRR